MHKINGDTKMKMYEEIVKKYFKESSPNPIYNSSKSHANVLIEQLIDSAKNDIYIYSGGNDYDFFNSYGVKVAISNLAKKGTPPNILILIDNADNLSKFSTLFPNAVIKVIKEPVNIDLSGVIPDNNYAEIRHFILADNKAFRVELEHEPNSEIVKAYGSANDEKAGNVLKEAFNYLFLNMAKSIA